MNKFFKYLLTLAVLTSSFSLQAEQSKDNEGGDQVEKYTETAEKLEASEAKRYKIAKVRVHGAKMVNENIIATSAGINVGDSITLPSPFVSTAISRLWDQRRYSDVQIGAEINGEDVAIDIFLKELPRVFSWDIIGVSKGQITELTDKMNLRRNQELSDYVIDKNSQIIKEFYKEKGFLKTEVTPIIKQDSVNDNMVNVTFDVAKGEKSRIGEIVFEGNEVFDNKTLRKAFKKTHQKSINFFQSNKLKEKDFEEDKVNLIDFYNSKGYRNASVLGDSIYDIDEKTLGIKVKVSEGNKYFIRDVSWVGNSKYETQQLQNMFGVQTGDTYDKKTMYKRLGVGKESNPDDVSILSMYQNEGYLMSQIEPAELIIGKDSIDLEIKVYEGNPFTINEVDISGNMRVDDEVIRRDLYTRPGELYNRSLLMQTMRTLSSMGHFNPEAIMPDIQPVSSDLVNIGWVLEEQASDQFNISGGWGAGTFVGSVGITLNNLSVKKMVEGGAWRPYPMGQNQKLNIQAQTNGTYYKAFSLSFTDPWMGGKKPNSFTASAHYSDQNDAYYIGQESTMHFRTLGIALGLGKRLSWPDPYFTLYTEASYERYMLKDWDSFIMQNGNANLISLKGVVARNSVDQPIYPRRGSEFSLSLQLTPPYSLFDGKDYSNPEMSDQSRYSMIEFHKWDLKTNWYQAFLKNSNLVLRLSAQMGYLGHYDKNKISPFERYEVGGDGMSGYNIYGIDVVSLRGYRTGELDPVGSDYSVAYNKYTVELRYPIILEPSSQIYALAFAEGGNGFNSWREFSPFNIKRSAGLGIRLYLPIVGMLGFDWGYGFDPPAGFSEKSGSQFHFVIGQQF